MLAFGPVPSRRLGKSLGVNNIPPKVCTYSCVYCQLGRTTRMQVERGAFYAPDEIWQAVVHKVDGARQAGETVDYVSFVPDGEPTLDVNLGREIGLLRQMGLPVAVISNASLLHRSDVRDDLRCADWVSLKVDAVDESAWRRVDRPHRTLRLDSILEGALEFAATYRGHLATETMLVAGLNDSDTQLRKVAHFLARLKPRVAYLSIPTRPPAESWVRAPDEEALNRAYQLLQERVQHVEYLIGYEGDAFACTTNLQDDLMSITAVHPMRSDAVDGLLARAGGEWAVVHELVEQGKLAEIEYEGHRFYLRRMGSFKGREERQSAGPSGQP
jgi:wyosine [tRNA(Phe)-imidazoG37] synthetase (radical SAM superfamily)